VARSCWPSNDSSLTEHGQTRHPNERNSTHKQPPSQVSRTLPYEQRHSHRRGSQQRDLATGLEEYPSAEYLLHVTRSPTWISASQKPQCQGNDAAKCLRKKQTIRLFSRIGCLSMVRDGGESHLLTRILFLMRCRILPSKPPALSFALPTST
jgi:hypothetical protein